MAEPDLALDRARAPVHGPLAAAAKEQRLFVASQWQLMWWRFRKHSGGGQRSRRHRLLPGGGGRRLPRLCRPPCLRGPALAHAPAARSTGSTAGGFSPHVRAVKGARDPQTFQRVYRADPSEKIPIRFFAEGFEYRFLGLIPTTAT